MCIKESLRLYPPVPFIAKELSEDFFVEGKRIPKGLATCNKKALTMITVLPKYISHKMKEYY